MLPYGALDGGPPYRLSILRNGNVPCRYFFNFPVDFKIVQCHLLILRNGNVPCHYFSKVPDDFKVVKCRLSNLENAFIQYGKDNVISNISSVKGKEVSNKGIRITLLTKP